MSTSNSSISDEEMDELMSELVTVASLSVDQQVQNSIGKQPKHTSTYKGWMWIRDILQGHDSLCIDMFRMEKKIFILLCHVLQEKYGLTSSRNMEVEEIVGSFLYTLAHASVNRNSQCRFSRSGETLSRRFKDVLNAMLKMSMDIIKPLDSDQRMVHPKIKNDERYFPFFKDCIGALDGTHIKCVVPSSSSARYIGRKGYATQNILAVCDWNMCFTFVLAGWEGTAHDSRIFNEARTSASSNFPHPPPGKYYLVDSGYPMLNGYIAPYRKERYHLPDFRRDRTIRNSNELFNYYHSSLRSIIERSFGVWKGRFRLLNSMTPYSFEMQRDIIVASMTIHNFIRRHTRTDANFLEYELNEELSVDDNSAGTTDMISNEIDELDINQASNEMTSLRDSIRDRLFSHYNSN